MKSITVQSPIPKKEYYVIPIYKLDITTGEVSILLKKACLKKDQSNLAIFDAANTGNWFGASYYFPILSKKYLNINSSFDEDYLKVLKTSFKQSFPTTYLEKIKYLVFCFEEDLVEANIKAPSLLGRIEDLYPKNNQEFIYDLLKYYITSRIDYPTCFYLNQTTDKIKSKKDKIKSKIKRRTKND